MLQYNVKNARRSKQGHTTPASRMAASKWVLRKIILNLLRSQKEEDRLRKSRAIQKKLFSTPEFQNANIILFYASFDGEVETFHMMKHAQRLGKKVALPKIIKDQKKIIPFLAEDVEKGLIEGPYGIKQPNRRILRPLPLKEIDLAIVPGVAFDRNNNRLGRGAGYYDRLLARFPLTTPTLGLAFDFQIVDSLPHHKNRDIPVTRVVSY